MKTTSKAFSAGYNEALSQTGSNTNPFEKGTDEHNGFEYFAACYGDESAVTDEKKEMANCALGKPSFHCSYQQAILEKYGAY